LATKPALGRVVDEVDDASVCRRLASARRYHPTQLSFLCVEENIAALEGDAGFDRLAAKSLR